MIYSQGLIQKELINSWNKTHRNIQFTLHIYIYIFRSSLKRKQCTLKIIAVSKNSITPLSVGSVPNTIV